jgi:DNA-binding GntR family transcriptional regulator
VPARQPAPVINLSEADRSSLDRTSTAVRVAEILRRRIAEGAFLPGTRLSEESISVALGISRNTLREAFRHLSHERLVVHELNRGVFIRELTSQDIVDLYRVRRIIECGAIRYAEDLSAEALADVEDAIKAGRKAVQAKRWNEAGTASIRFHEAIAALSGSERVKEMAGNVMAEFRLSLPLLPDVYRQYKPNLARHETILDALKAGDRSAAENELDAYLRASEQQLLSLFQPA